MKLGIVGSEARKFTPETEAIARTQIDALILNYGADLVISGHSPLGGIDWWAVEEARKLGVEVLEFPAATSDWEHGFKPRNLQIAGESDIVACVVVKELPPSYRGRRFPQGCYHCHTPPGDHVKSGGCWTMKQANRLGKPTELVVVW